MQCKVKLVTFARFLRYIRVKAKSYNRLYYLTFLGSLQDNYYNRVSIIEEENTLIQ